MAEAEPPPEPPPTMPEVKQIAIGHGYGGNVADSIYALCMDGTIWARLVTRDSKWEQMSNEVAPAIKGWINRL